MGYSSGRKFTAGGFMVQKKMALPLSLLLICALALILIQQGLLGISLTAPSPYNTYTLQALAWREGRAHLAQDVPHLELAIFEGRYYVSFPPVPSVPIYFLTFIFGAGVPDGLMVLLYALISVFVLWKLLYRKGFTSFAAAAWSFLALFASSLLPLTLSGAVWYQAQVLGLMLILIAAERLDAGKPFWGLVCYALSVGCRPFNALYGPLLLILCLGPRLAGKKSFKYLLMQLLPGLLAGLLIAALYGWYNAIRFGSPLEFGHNHLPEFSFQGGTQFSLAHVGKNVRDYLFALPFIRTGQGLTLRIFGFSLFLANPVLLLMVIWAAALGITKKIKLEQVLIFVFFMVHLFLLLLHRTFGGFQFGARYAVDLLPYAMLFLARRERKSITIAEAAVMLAGLAFSVYGSLTVHL